MSASSCKNRSRTILTVLKKTYPEAECSLSFGSSLELLIAVILSAQCTDVQVNKVTPELFRRFKTVRGYADASVHEIEEVIRPTGFFHNKAKHIQHCCRMIADRFGGEVPDTMEALTSLPGVGRKTANVVLGNAFGKNEGFVVDTHVFRLSHRLGLAEGTTPEKTEQELMKLFPQADWSYLSHALIRLGREFCTSRSPKCGGCPLNKCCPAAAKKTDKP